MNHFTDNNHDNDAAVLTSPSSLGSRPICRAAAAIDIRPLGEQNMRGVGKGGLFSMEEGSMPKNGWHGGQYL